MSNVLQEGSELGDVDCVAVWRDLLRRNTIHVVPVHNGQSRHGRDVQHEEPGVSGVALLNCCWVLGRATHRGISIKKKLPVCAIRSITFGRCG